MLWSDEVLAENSREMKRLWLAGTIAAGICADGHFNGVAESAILLADKILEELAKNNPWEKRNE